jgi:tetratricopeptide (TPR) repeat protein
VTEPSSHEYFARAVIAYQQALDELIPDSGKGLPEQHKPDAERLIALLVARDQLADHLTNGTNLSTDIVRYITTLDRRLERKVPAIAADVGHELDKTRRSLQRPESAWWWHLDRHATPVKSSFETLAGIAVVGALVYIIYVGVNFLFWWAGGVDLWTFLQVLIPVLLISTVTNLGQRFVRWLTAVLPVPARYGSEVKVALAVIGVVLVIGINTALPTVAREFNDYGVASHAEGDTVSAIANYQRALSLKPDYAQAHYNLGNAYEDLLQYDEAIAAYQMAIGQDDRFYYAYNNLARLYIIHWQQPGAALELLDHALKHSPPDEHLYAIHKNRGWATWQLGYHNEAHRELTIALRIRPGGAAASCLLAQVYETTGGTADEIAALWDTCLANADRWQDDYVEASWLVRAREHIQTLP